MSKPGRAGLPPLGLGMAPIGKRADADANAVVGAAWERGIRYFDTAPLYGGGRSELRAGVALTGRPREGFVLSTKVGAFMRDGQRFVDHSYEAALASFESSLDRLGLDAVDLLYVHDPGDSVPQALEGAYRAAEELRAQGRVRAIGAGVNSVDEATAFVLGSDADAIMLAGRYTLLDSSAAEEFFPLCVSRGVDVVAAGVFNSGILAGGTATFDYAPADDEIVGRVEQIAAVCAEHDVPLGAAALQFVMRHPAVSSTVVGASSVEQLTEWADWATLDIDPALWDDLARAGVGG